MYFIDILLKEKTILVGAMFMHFVCRCFEMFFLQLPFSFAITFHMFWIAVTEFRTRPPPPQKVTLGVGFLTLSQYSLLWPQTNQWDGLRSQNYSTNRRMLCLIYFYLQPSRKSVPPFCYCSQVKNRLRMLRLSANENAIRNALSQSLSFPAPLDKGNVDSGNEIGPHVLHLLTDSCALQKFSILFKNFATSIPPCKVVSKISFLT